MQSYIYSCTPFTPPSLFLPSQPLNVTARVLLLNEEMLAIVPSQSFLDNVFYG